MRVRADEKGQMLVLTALAIVALLGFLALAVDVGLLFRAKRQVQTAADAGAIAGALEYWYNGTGAIGSAAGTAVGNNGVTLSYTPSLNTSCPSTTANCAIVNTSTSAITGYHNQLGYVQVIVSQPNPTFFMGLFGHSKVNVTASSIAGIAPGTACIITLDPSGSNSFWIKGNSNINTPNCGIQVNSTSTTAVCIQGSAGINGPYLLINGDQSVSGQCNKSSGAPVTQGAGSTADDPFASIYTPNPANDCQSSIGGGAGNISPLTSVTSLAQITSLTGYLPTLPSGSKANAIPANYVYCFQNNVTFSGALALPPGIYLFENGVNFASGSTVSFGINSYDPSTGLNDNGATLENYQGTFNNQNGNVSIYAPADKTNAILNTIALYQPYLTSASPAGNTNGTCQDSSLKVTLPQTCLQAQFGSNNLSNLVGYIYAPNSTVYLQDQGGGVQASGVVSYDFYNNSQLSITNSFNSFDPTQTALSTVALVE